VMSRLLNEHLFDVPDRLPAGTQIRITRELVREKLTGLLENKDLRSYIL